MLPFREITLEDKQQVEECGSHYYYHLCERCFVDLFMWRSHYNTQICFRDGFLLVKMTPLDGGHDCYLAPIGEGDLGDALDALEQDATERGIPFVVVSVAEPMIERIEAVRPGKFVFSHDNEDGDDYIYLAEKLRTLSGKKLQSKRNLVNRFQAAYEGRWSYEPMTKDNLEECFQAALVWRRENGCEEDEENPNRVQLTGALCKPPSYRTTPFGREIADLMLAVNRSYGKSDYIPCITWGRTARYAANLKIGDRVQLVGRFQSRAYQKQLPDGTSLNKVAYEVSVSRLNAVREEPRPDFRSLPPQMQSPGALTGARDCQGARS